MHDIDQVAEALKLPAVPEQMRSAWDSYLKWLPENGCVPQSWEIPPDAARVFDLPPEVLGPLESACRAISENPALAELARFRHYAVFHHPIDVLPHPWLGPEPLAILGDEAWLQPLAVLVSGTEHAVEFHRRKGIPEDAMFASLAFGGLYVRRFRERKGLWGLHMLGWMRHYIQARLLRLGRLVFGITSYDWPFRVYRNRRDGSTAILCDGGRFRADGMADGTGGIFDPEPWTASLETTDKLIRGHAVSPEGTAVREPITLRAGEWEQVVGPGDDQIDVHIPSGGKLSVEECTDSYRRALELLPKLYPDRRLPVFTCWTWLLDPALKTMLGPESNIIRFQNPYRLVPLAGNEKQCYDLVFGDPEIDITKAPRDTYLQRAIADYVTSGGRMCQARGIILWEEMRRLVGSQGGDGCAC